MPNDEMLKEMMFPYPKSRDIQTDMLNDVNLSLKEKRHMILHAPTGIGKTVSVLAPALAHAMKNDLTVFFLTSRHTQHRIAVETLADMKKKHDAKFTVSDIIGKQGMCLQPGIPGMFAGDFHEFCKSLREEGKCEFYTNTRNANNSPTVEAKIALNEIKESGPLHVGGLIEAGERKKLCPYELAILNAADSKVIIADYYYIFSDYIREGFLLKTKKELEKSIIIVDEGHNLPNRIRELMTAKISGFSIEMALKEAKKMGYSETVENLQIINSALLELSDTIKENEDRLVQKEEFAGKVSREKDYDDIASELMHIGEEIRKEKKASFVLSVGKFLEKWPEGEQGFSRILAKGKYLTLSLRCLDPSIATKGVIDRSYSTIIMSGTLTPTSMYKDVLGFPASTIEKEYGSPFPNENRLVCVVPKTTTKFSRRSNEQFLNIAKSCADIINKVKGCSVVFFPSYEIMGIVSDHITEMTGKTVFTEKQRLSKEQKEEFLLNFKAHKDKGAVLLAVSSGSFGEGIDLPGVLSAVIVAGLPLQRPDLEVRELIKYYDKKFSNGWDYGYVMPAITKCLQNAGRCIRSETDRGIIVFLDERYAWPQYFRCFPKEWDVKINESAGRLAEEFFRK
ncbi:ATP-dependent DNA helicase [Candidatus Woesearchaeota archaeon]|nr:ATP-dependent DNA helicase [Candidatus Woesearchaeota archaeon]